MSSLGSPVLRAQAPFPPVCCPSSNEAPSPQPQVPLPALSSPSALSSSVSLLSPSSPSSSQWAQFLPVLAPSPQPQIPFSRPSLPFPASAPPPAFPQFHRPHVPPTPVVRSPSPGLSSPCPWALVPRLPGEGDVIHARITAPRTKSRRGPSIATRLTIGCPAPCFSVTPRGGSARHGPAGLGLQN